MLRRGIKMGFRVKPSGSLAGLEPFGNQALEGP